MVAIGTGILKGVTTTSRLAASGEAVPCGAAFSIGTRLFGGDMAPVIRGFFVRWGLDGAGDGSARRRVAKALLVVAWGRRVSFTLPVLTLLIAVLPRLAALP